MKPNLLQSLSLLFFLFAICLGYSQHRFVETFESTSFSPKKITKVELLDGTVLSGKFTFLRIGNGSLFKITLLDDTGKKIKLTSDEIRWAILPLTDIKAKINTAVKKLDNSSNLGIENGVLYEKVINKKGKSVLAQLLNPTFAGDIKVYHDFKAKEKKTVLGTLTNTDITRGYKSYIITKKGSDAALIIKKNKYSDVALNNIFDGCKKLREHMEGTLKFKDMADHVAFFNKHCGN